MQAQVRCLQGAGVAQAPPKASRALPLHTPGGSDAHRRSTFTTGKPPAPLQRPTAGWQHSRGGSLACRASPANSPFPDDSAAAQIPESREQAVEQAAAAVAAQLSGGKKAKAKGFAGSGGTKFSVDIPVADASSAAALALAQDLVQRLPPTLRSQFTIVAAQPGASSGGGGGQQGGAKVVSLQECLAEGRQLAGCLLVVGATRQQIGDVSRLLGGWRGPGAVLLNADWWADDSIPPEHAAFVASFEAVYSFVPLEVKAFVTTQQGAVFKWARSSGAPSSAPWRIFALEGKAWAAVGRMQRRPTQADIETAFYNAAAAKSPLTAVAKGFRNLLPGQKK